MIVQALHTLDCLSRGNGDFAFRGGKRTVLKLKTREERPRARLEHETERLRDINDDLTFSRLARRLVLLDVRSARIANPSRHVKETQARNGELTEVLEVTVDNQVRETVLTAEETGFPSSNEIRGRLNKESIFVVSGRRRVISPSSKGGK